MIDEHFRFLKQPRQKPCILLFLERMELLDRTRPHRLVKHFAEFSESVTIRSVSQTAIPADTAQTVEVNSYSLVVDDMYDATAGKGYVQLPSHDSSRPV